MSQSAHALLHASADIMSFSGLLPELINSRAAMFGMLAAFGAELGSRQPLFVQVVRCSSVLHYLTLTCTLMPSQKVVHPRHSASLNLVKPRGAMGIVSSYIC